MKVGKLYTEEEVKAIIEKLPKYHLVELVKKTQYTKAYISQVIHCKKYNSKIWEAVRELLIETEKVSNEEEKIHQEIKNIIKS